LESCTAQTALVEPAPQLEHRARELEVVHHREHEAALARQRRQLLALLERHRERLLREHVLAGLEGAADHALVRERRGAAGDRLDVVAHGQLVHSRGLLVVRHPQALGGLAGALAAAIRQAAHVESAVAPHRRDVAVGGHPARAEAGNRDP
jgi:hypothetical protein